MSRVNCIKLQQLSSVIRQDGKLTWVAVQLLIKPCTQNRYGPLCKNDQLHAACYATELTQFENKSSKTKCMQATCGRAVDPAKTSPAGLQDAHAAMCQDHDYCMARVITGIGHVEGWCTEQIQNDGGATNCGEAVCLTAGVRSGQQRPM